MTSGPSRDVAVTNSSSRSKLRLLLVNPNTSQASTELMLRTARHTAGPDVLIEGLTAPFGASLITDESALETAVRATVSAVRGIPAPYPDGVIIAAFGDPGLTELRGISDFEVTGLAEASMHEAADGDRNFSVATTTPMLTDAIRRCAELHGLGDKLLSVRITTGNPQDVMADGATLVAALKQAVLQAIEADGAEAIIIGGGPLADAARDLAGLVSVPIIEPIPAAVRLILTRIRAEHEAQRAREAR